MEQSFAEKMIGALRERIGDKKAVCALSGGVDSTVSAVLVHKAIGKQLTCIFVDTGLLRQNEADDVEKLFTRQFDMNFIRVNAAERFLSKLKGVTEPEAKRRIVGEEFIRVFEEEAKQIGAVDFLVQGTIYPDVVESGTDKSALVKSHHNVGGLPEAIDFKELVEPLRDLYKEDVRQAGRLLGIPDDVVSRQPFPGPGLAVRCLGEVNEEKLSILRAADLIFRDEIAKAGLDKSIWQFFAILPNLLSVGVKDGKRTYCHTVALRAVYSRDAMTAKWSEVPFDTLRAVSDRIVGEVPMVNRVVFDITDKPPATIEWE